MIPRLAVIAAALLALLSLMPTAVSAASQETEVRITAQRLADGRTEFALQRREADDGWSERLLPRARYFPATATVGRWLSSTPLTVRAPGAGDDAEGAEVRITARRLADDRIEFALQEREADDGWSERLLPRARFFPATATVGRWLSSTPLALRDVDVGSAASDRAALVEFYNAAGRAGWLTNWASNLPLDQWDGVTTNSDGRVTRLEIESYPGTINFITSRGPRTVETEPLMGSIPTVLSDLSQLEVLVISGNSLTGPIPPDLGNLTQLEYLDLAYNELTGPIPTEVARLDHLERLSLSGNALTGPIPPELGNLTDLSRLDLRNNELSGPIPPELGNLTKVYWLDLAENDLSGDVPPELGNLTELRTFYLGGNQLTGCIPGTLSSTGESGLRFCERAEDRAALIALYEATGGENWVYSINWLSDHHIDDWYGVTAHLGTVTRLGLGGNNLTGPIPPEFGDLADLERLALGGNNLTGPIPPEFGDLANLEWLELGGNNLTGPIPPEFGDLADLERLELGGNNLTGPIPPELGRLTRLRRLNLENHGLTGPIPRELGDLADLDILGLTGNDLSGPIPPELGNLTNLRELRLNENELTGPIPPELGKLANLTLMDLAVNQLMGPIPSELGSLTNLGSLYLNVNQLTGPIPPELEGMTNLRHLVLSWNQLSGAIPSGLEHLANLEELWLEGNQTGCVPGGLPNLGWYAPTACDAVGDRAALVALYEATDGPNWTRNANWLTDRPLWEWEGVKTDRGYVTELQLTNNGLRGQIPPEIGNLAGLMHLVLSANQLTGPIPPELGNLMRLTWLSLDFNQMSGPIPPELGNLTELRILHLGNDFTGCLPVGLPPFSGGPPYCSE